MTRSRALWSGAALAAVLTPRLGIAAAPSWMRGLVAATAAGVTEKTNAALVYADTVVAVQPNGRIQRIERRAYRILRPDGASRGKLVFVTDGQTRITDVLAWCIPASGKDFEVKRRDAVEAGLSNVENGMLATDIRALVLQVPAATPGSLIGYELTEDQTPYVLADSWSFQDTIPVREARYRLQLPKGWTYRATWLNHAETAPSATGPNSWQWTLSNVEALRLEPHMPFPGGIVGRMFVALIPPNGHGMQDWNDLGVWFDNLAHARRDPSPELKQKVAELTASAPDAMDKMQALARFVQDDIRYVGIELGIGGYQPHFAADVLSQRFGDCKDKATLLSAMLEQIGIHSYYVLINTARGAVNAETPPNPYFNHAILAVALPDDLQSPVLEASVTHPKLGRLLFFDPTNPLTPFGALSGSLQKNFGLLVLPEGGELIELPQLNAASNGIARTATFHLDGNGTLRGDVREVRLGHRAAEQRFALRTAKLDTDQIKPVESLLAASLATFQVTKAEVANLRAPDRPFEWRYSIEVDHYARPTGALLLVRPRVIGTKLLKFLDSAETREYPIEFDEPERDTDRFDIALPEGYEIDELPPPVDLDDGFAAYHSKTEVVGRTLHYSREYRISTVSVPADKADQLRALYRVIESDERTSAVLKRSGPAQR